MRLAKPRGWYCSVCKHARERERWHKRGGWKNSEQYQQSKRRAWLRHYGLTEEIVAQTLTAQKNRCQICRCPGRLFPDHDHVTDKFRGFLCADCNSGLARYHDNPHLLRRASYYLEGKL